MIPLPTSEAWWLEKGSHPLLKVALVLASESVIDNEVQFPLPIDIQADAPQYINTANNIVTPLQSYRDGNTALTINKVENGTGADKITYYVADCFVTNVKYLATGSAGGEYSTNILGNYNATPYLLERHPREAIGYVSPGHYVFVVVDGRQKGYSRGVDFNELAQIMQEQGCIIAYNLDGGHSVMMMFQGQMVNQPVEGGRDFRDIVYIS